MGAVTYSEDTPYGLGPNATYFNSPGSVENYLSWIGGAGSGSRGEAPTKDRPASVQITGEAEVLANLSHILSAAPKRAMKRLEQNCEYILSESKKEAPWDTTHLMQTGTVEPLPEGDGFQIGYNTPYAERQHEDMTFHHPKPGAKAKYLEDPAMRIAPTIAEDIAESLKELLA
jgi:hypothetical protein